MRVVIIMRERDNGALLASEVLAQALVQIGRYRCHNYDLSYYLKSSV